MKQLRLSFIALMLVAAQTGLAQTAHLKLSDEHPTPGEKITMTYDTVGTPLAGKSPLQATLFYFKGNVQASCINIDLNPSGHILQGSFIVPQNAMAFFIKPFVKQDDNMMMHMEKQFDNNDGEGYVYMVYRKGQPVKGAYAALSNIYSGAALQWGKIKSKIPEAFADLQRDISQYPELKAEYNSNYYLLYTNLNHEKNRASVLATIDSLASNTNETDNRLAVTLYQMTDDTVKAKIARAHILSAYPDGDKAKGEALLAIRKEKDADKRLLLFSAYRKRFTSLYPSNKNDMLGCEFALRAVYTSYAEKGLYKEAEQVGDSVQRDDAKADSYRSIASKMIEAGQDPQKVTALLDKSDSIYRHILSDLEPYNVFTVTPDEFRKILGDQLDENTDVRALLSYSQGKYVEALKMEQPVYDRLSKTHNDVNTHYARILVANGQPEKAISALAVLIKTGRASGEQITELKKAYVAAHKSESGYDDYLAGLNMEAKSLTTDKIAKTMINEPAPQFTLRDLQGEQVSLANLRGKVVVVDFWATWCGPCKASFPGMQLAVNKYRDSPDVKFVFIDTWERGEPEAYLPAVKKFIADNSYTFHVLIDEKDTAGRQAKVINSFKVEGIPTKFIIDKTGQIRFKVTGFSGTAQNIMENVSTMIELAAKPSLAAVKQ